MRLGMGRAAALTAAAVVMASIALMAGNATAQGLVSGGKPMRIVVAFASGGPVDVPARALAQRLTDALGQQVIVENIPGAGGLIGADAVAKSAPDGHSMLITTSALSIQAASVKKMPFDPQKDLASVGLVAVGDLLLVMNPRIPAKNARELFAAAKAKPGALTFASAGIGSSTHLAGELLKMQAAIDIVHLPYKGVAPAVTDLIGGHVDLLFSSVAAMLPQIKSGKVRAIALASLTRSSRLPDLPTFNEDGLPGFEVASRNGIMVSGSTPRDTIVRLNAALVKILATQDTRDFFASNGLQAVSSTPEQFAAELRAEITKWTTVIKTARLELDQ